MQSWHLNSQSNSSLDSSTSIYMKSLILVSRIHTIFHSSSEQTSIPFALTSCAAKFIFITHISSLTSWGALPGCLHSSAQRPLVTVSGAGACVLLNASLTGGTSSTSCLLLALLISIVPSAPFRRVALRPSMFKNPNFRSLKNSLFSSSKTSWLQRLSIDPLV